MRHRRILSVPHRLRTDVNLAQVGVQWKPIPGDNQGTRRKPLRDDR